MRKKRPKGSRNRIGRQPGKSTLSPLWSLHSESPPLIQRETQKVMKASWRDPTDTRPGVMASVREISGYRRLDPLRFCLKRHGNACGITERHIIAADLLRVAADGAAIGFSAPRDMLLPISSIQYRPSTGPDSQALHQQRCWRGFVRVSAIFSKEDLLLLIHVVILNWSVAKWVRVLNLAGQRADARREMSRLIAALDRLVEHYDSGIDAAIGKGMAA
jgi:hypothetical protein